MERESSPTNRAGRNPRRGASSGRGFRGEVRDGAGRTKKVEVLASDSRSLSDFYVEEDLRFIINQAWSRAMHLCVWRKRSQRPKDGDSRDARFA